MGVGGTRLYILMHSPLFQRPGKSVLWDDFHGRSIELFLVPASAPCLV